MTKEQANALAAVDHLIRQLRLALAPGDRRVGWSEAKQEGWLSLALRARASVASGQLPGVDVPRCLDADSIPGNRDVRQSPLTQACLEFGVALDDWLEAQPGPPRKA